MATPIGGRKRRSRHRLIGVGARGTSAAVIPSRPWSRARVGRLVAALTGLPCLAAPPHAALAAPTGPSLSLSALAAPTAPDDRSPPAADDPTPHENAAAGDDRPAAAPAHRDLSRTGRGSAFAVPVADRLDPYGPRPPGVPALSRDQIIRYALHNPLVLAAEEKIDAMKAQARKAQFAWLPIIDTVATLSPGANIACDDLVVDARLVEGGPPLPSDEFQFQWCRPAGNDSLDLTTVQGYFSQLGRAGVRVSFDADAVFPLFTFGKIKHSKSLAKAAVALAKLEKLQIQQESIKLVLQAHTGLLLARESQVILRDAKGVVDKARARVEADLGGSTAGDDWDADADVTNPARDPNDLIKVELAEIEVEQKMRAALRAEALALAALWDLAGAAAPPGFDVREDALLAFEVDGGLQSLDAYRQLAIRERPEAHMARAAVQARQAQEKLARAGFLPDLGLAVGVGFAVSNAVDTDMNRLYYQDRFNYSRVTAALAMRWRWDFHNRAFDLQKARAELRAQEYTRDAAALLLGQDVARAYEDVLEADERIALTRRATDLSWQLVVSLEQRDMVAGGDAERLLRALTDWYKKRFEAAEAIHDHNEAVARLSRATGTDLIAPGPGAAPSSAARAAAVPPSTKPPGKPARRSPAPVAARPGASPARPTPQ
jgi:outer membrane protein TolC